MKTLCTILSLLILSITSVSAQYETTFTLYDTIAEGPYIEPEKSGYAFLFKTREEGTMVSTRGQVMNPAVDYHLFNHYHLKGDGALDSLFTIPIRQEVGSHYTMYKRGLPKLIQYRVGTSNDPSLSRILEKYPIISTPRNNDELHSVNSVSVDGNKYERLTKIYEKGGYKEQAAKALIELESEEGRWSLQHVYSAENIDLPLTLLTYGKEITDDKTRKYNHKMEFRFIAVDNKGDIVRDEEITYDRAYDVYESGVVHAADGSLSGFFMSLSETAGRANKDQNSSLKKILFFDEKGILESETMVTLPYEPKAKEVAMQRVVKVLKNDGVKKIFVHTPGVKKEKIGEGYFCFNEGPEDVAELVNFKNASDVNLVQDQRNNFEGGPPASTDYSYAVRLENGDLLSVASERGTDLQFIQTSEKGEMVRRSAGYMLNDIGSQKNILSFEYLDNQKLLISSKVGYEKAVYTSYGIYDSRSGVFKTIQPTEDIASIYSYRNGDDIMVFGSSFEDEKTIHLIMHKLAKKEEGISSVEQD